MSVVLVLNADYSLIEVITWQRAVTMILLEKVRLVEHYSGRVLRATSMSMPFPAVVVWTRYVRAHRRVRFSRRHVLARDRHTCQYCGARPRRAGGAPALDRLTLDHVVPRQQATEGRVLLPWSGARVRVTSWQNVLTACRPCNGRKANRTPSQAGMAMLSRPRAPGPVELAWLTLTGEVVPEEWRNYLPDALVRALTG
jgi:5-methylcytosine-specific restriction endonuclease McrA